MRLLPLRSYSIIFFFFNDTATTEIYTLSLHDALPILRPGASGHRAGSDSRGADRLSRPWRPCPAVRIYPYRHPGCPSDRDRKSTRLNSSHANISYAVFCLKKKKTKNKINIDRTHV